MGREHSTQWEKPPLNDTREQTAGAERGIAVPSVRETSIFYICMAFYSLQNTSSITPKPHSDLRGGHNYRYFPDEEIITQK